MAELDINKLESDLFSGFALNVSFSLMERLISDEGAAWQAGLDEHDISQLMSLDPKEYTDMVREMSRNIVSIKVDAASVTQWIAKYQARKSRRELLISLLRHGASNAQIQEWFALSYRDVQLERKNNKCPAEPGKKRTVTEKEYGDMSVAWVSASMKHRDNPDCDMLACLDASDATGMAVSFFDQLEVRKVKQS